MSLKLYDKQKKYCCFLRLVDRSDHWYENWCVTFWENGVVAGCSLYCSWTIQVSFAHISVIARAATMEYCGFWGSAIRLAFFTILWWSWTKLFRFVEYVKPFGIILWVNARELEDFFICTGKRMLTIWARGYPTHFRNPPSNNKGDPVSR